MLRVKICGNRATEDIALAGAMGADAVGLTVGVRHRSEDSQELANAAILLRFVPIFVTSVLVTHLIAADQVIRLHATVPTTAIQLHDAIPVEAIVAIRTALPHVPLIKAIGVTDVGSIETAYRFAPHVDALLLDSHTQRTASAALEGCTIGRSAERSSRPFRYPSSLPAVCGRKI